MLSFHRPIEILPNYKVYNELRFFSILTLLIFTGPPLSSGQPNNQIQAVRFNPQLIVDNSQNNSGVTHQIITMQQVHAANSQNQVPVQQSQQSQPSQQTHVQIPISSKTPVQSPRASILRKRDSEG